MSMTYGACHSWKDRTGILTIECSGYPSMDSACDRVAKCLHQDGYRLPRWWELSRRGEYIPDWLRQRLKQMETKPTGAEGGVWITGSGING